jgi:hypothetical protein
VSSLGAGRGVCGQVLSHIFKASGIILAVFVVTTMGPEGTRLPLKASEPGIGFAQYRTKDSLSFYGNWLCQKSSGQMREFHAEFAESIWIARKSISIYGGTPYEDASLPMPRITQCRFRNLNVDLIGALRPIVPSLLAGKSGNSYPFGKSSNCGLTLL